MGGIYNKQKEMLEKFKSEFAVEKDDVGIIYAFNDEIVGLDLFYHPDILKFYFPQILQSLALDCLEITNKQKHPTLKLVKKLFNQVLYTHFESWITLTSCEIFKTQSDKFIGNVLCHDNKIVHLAIFPKHLKY